MQKEREAGKGELAGGKGRLGDGVDRLQRLQGMRWQGVKRFLETRWQGEDVAGR